MFQRNSVSRCAIAAVLAGLLSLSPVAAALAGTRQAGVRVGRWARYPKGWPRRIPIRVGEMAHGPLLASYIKGPEYWHSLAPATQARLDTFAKLQRYCQQHEGAWPL